MFTVNFVLYDLLGNACEVVSPNILALAETLLSVKYRLFLEETVLLVCILNWTHSVLHRYLEQYF